MTNDDRDEALMAVLPLMAALRPGVRAALAEMTRSPFDHQEALKRRRHLLRRYHRIAYAGLSDKAAAECISSDIAKRSGSSVRSTGSNVKDQAVDEILLISLMIAVRTIRLDLAPG